MATGSNVVFDPKAFLATVGEGRSVTKSREGEVVFSQGDPADALCLFCGPVGDGRFAVPWTPQRWTGDGAVDPLFVWAALDCPSSAPAHDTIAAPVVLGRLTVALERSVEVGAPHVIQSWLERVGALPGRWRAPRHGPRRMGRAGAAARRVSPRFGFGLRASCREAAWRGARARELRH